MKNLSCILTVVIISLNSANCQVILFSPEDTLRGHLLIGQSSDNTFTKGQEAGILATFPASDSLQNNWLANVFIELVLESDSSKFSLGLVGELHKNTLISKIQDVRQIGLSAGKDFYISNAHIPVSLTLKYSDNKISNSKNFQLIVGFTYARWVGTPYLRTQTPFPSYKSALGKILRFEHNHNLGFAYLGGDDKLAVGQFDFNFDVYFLPMLSDILFNRLDLFKFQFLYSAGARLWGDTNMDLNNLLDFQIGINCPFDKNNSIGLAYDWIQGADPLKGLNNQKYSTFAIKTKLKL
jgi:hypothetical protein